MSLDDNFGGRNTLNNPDLCLTSACYLPAGTKIIFNPGEYNPILDLVPGQEYTIKETINWDKQTNEPLGAPLFRLKEREDDSPINCRWFRLPY